MHCLILVARTFASKHSGLAEGQFVTPKHHYMTKNMVKQEKFDNFVSKVSKSVPQYFKDENELIKKLTKAIDNEIKNHPQKGWIRL